MTKGTGDTPVRAPVLSLGTHRDYISVIVVSYNARRYLARCVDSVLASTVPATVLLVDNASSDGSIEELEDHYLGNPRVTILRNSANVGFAKACNRALRLVTSEYVVFLNPDCFLQPASLEQVREQMQRRPDAGMAGCMVRNPDGSEQAGARRAIPTPWRTLVRVLHLDHAFPGHPRFRNFHLTDQPVPRFPVTVEGISGAFMFVRRAAVQQVGPLDEGYFLHCEDLDWFMRFRAGGWQILFVPDVEIVHVKGGCSTRNPVQVLWHKHRGMVRFYRKFFSDQYPVPLIWVVNAAVWGRFSVLALYSFLKRGSCGLRRSLRRETV